VVFAAAEEETKAAESAAVEDTNADESKAEALVDKKQEKRGIHEYGDWSHGHEEKTLTIVKKIPVPGKIGNIF
jgi:hypothetical protein